MMGIYNSIGTSIGTLMSLIGKVNLSNRGHSREYYIYLENNGCPPPSCYEYVIDETAHTYRLKS